MAFTFLRIIASWSLFRTLPPAHAVGAPAALAVTALALLGYWRMRRWGLWLALVGTTVRVAAGLAGAIPVRAVDLLWPGLILLVGFIYFSRLR